MPLDAAQDHCCTHPMGLPLHLKRCAPGCMWLLAEGMQSLERGPEDGTKEEERRADARLADGRLLHDWGLRNSGAGFSRGIDRLVVLAELLFGGLFCRVCRVLWKKNCDPIHEVVVESGFKKWLNSFRQAYGLKELDASIGTAVGNTTNGVLSESNQQSA